MSDLDATNYNRNYLLWGRTSSRGNGQAPDPGYVVTNNTLVAGELLAGVPGARSMASTTRSRARTRRRPRTTCSFEAELPLSDALAAFRADRHCPRVTARRRRRTCPRRCPARATARAGSSRDRQRAGLRLWRDRHSTPVPGGTPVHFGWIFGAQFVDVEDEETWAQIDADFRSTAARGPGSSSACGTTSTSASRSTRSPRVRLSAAARPAAAASIRRIIRDNLHALSDRLQHLRRHPPDRHLVLVARRNSRRTTARGDVGPRPAARQCCLCAFEVEEKNAAAYVQANFKGASWSGNLGGATSGPMKHVVTYTQTVCVGPGRDPDARCSGPVRLGFRSKTATTTGPPEREPQADISDDRGRAFAFGRTMTRAGLFGARRRHRPVTTGHRRRDRLRHRRQPGPRADPVEELRRRRLNGISPIFVAASLVVLHGPRQLRRLRQRDQHLLHLQLAVPGRPGRRSTC